MIFKDVKNGERFYRYPENFTKGVFKTKEGTAYSAKGDSGTRVTFYDDVEVGKPKSTNDRKELIKSQIILKKKINGEL